MPSNWLYVESQCPSFDGDETVEEKLAQLQNYLYLLVEQMRYTTQNLDTTNMNQAALQSWEEAITKPLYVQLEGEGERITQLAATADGIKAMVRGQQESIQDLQESARDQIQVIQQVQTAVGEQGGIITDIQGTVTAQEQQLAQLEFTAQGISATVQEQETKLTEFEGTLTAQGEEIGALEGTIQSQSEKLADLALTADGLTATVAEQTQSITQLTGTVVGQGERLEQLGENLTSFSDTVTGSLGEMQAQIDGQIQTWFDRELPTLDNAPANQWESEEDKVNHLGDLYYVVENEDAGGQAYRWALVDGTYKWVLIEDVEVAKALADAARAQDTADGKRRVFVTQPVPPYDVGDLWAQGDSGDLMRCNTARPMGIYLASDWGKASDYTNDDALHAFVDGTFTQTREEMTQRLSQLEVEADAISATVTSQTTAITKLENTSLTKAVTEYYLSTSKTELAGGSWSETAPEWTEGKYMWSRTKTVTAAGTESYTTPVCDSSWETVKAVEDEVANQGQIIQTQESRLSDLEINTNAITATVQRMETETKTSLDGVEESISQLTQRVDLSLTSDQVEIAIEEKLAQGVDSVTTKTGFTFDENGLNISKSGSEMTTLVSEDGMKVIKSGQDMLVANNQGVQATNLHAATFLTIGDRVRFEKYGTDRIGCFWIGG